MGLVSNGLTTIVGRGSRFYPRKANRAAANAGTRTRYSPEYGTRGHFSGAHARAFSGQATLKARNWLVLNRLAQHGDATTERPMHFVTNCHQLSESYLRRIWRIIGC